jgi:hypothetical protein
MLLMGLLPAAALAIPESYSISSGQVTSVQVASPFSHTTPCEVGSTGNCLVNAPIGISQGSITLDTAAGNLIDIAMTIPGPGRIELGGFFDIESIVFTNAEFATIAPAPMTSLGNGVYQFGPSQGQLTMDIVVTDSLGHVQIINGYVIPGGPAGTLVMNGGGASLELLGVEMGEFCSPINPTRCAYLEANFEFTADRVAPAIPEPAAFLLFGFGALLIVRRWTPAPASIGIL